jgi:hypothetical protein
LFDNTHNPAPGIQLELGRDCGRPVDILEIEGDVVSEHAGKLEEAIWQRLPDLRPLGADQSGAYQHRTEVQRSEPLALTQQLLAYHLLRAFAGDSSTVFAPPVAALSRLNSAPSTIAGNTKKREDPAWLTLRRAISVNWANVIAWTHRSCSWVRRHW